MHHYWRFALATLFLVLCGWGSATPLYAHHTAGATDVDGTDVTVTDMAQPGISGAALSATDFPIPESVDAAAVGLPPNFIARTVVSGLTLPTDMVILPSGDFLVTEKGEGSSEFSRANVRLVRGGVLIQDPVVTLSVNTFTDSGLMGIILDPQFATNHYFYLWYSTGAEALGWTGTTTNRLSRFVFDPASGTAPLASETIILDGIQWAEIHNGGGMVFDDVGNILVTTGDAGTPNEVPAMNLAQHLDSLNGKVLRIHPRAEGGYDVPADNPFVGNTTGIRPEIYASGFRNPFRMTRRASDHQIYVADVGQDTWEEVDRLTPGANYGWPYREGKCGFYERGPDCTPTPSQFTDPLLDYIHPVGVGAGLTALAFYEGTQWPEAYWGHLFFADFDSGVIRNSALTADDMSFTNFATDIVSMVDMEATADGLYGVSIVEGSIKFIYYDAEGNHPPVATLSVSVVSGAAPLPVQFTATAQDDEHDDLAYHWNFGDGSGVVAASPSATHVYTGDGDYLATLQVVDEDGGQSEILGQLIQVYSSNMATIVVDNLTEAGRYLYHGGDHIKFSATRVEGTEGLDPNSPYSWTILLHHNEHVHVLTSGYITSALQLDIPVEPHTLGVPISYEIRLEMRTASGQRLHTSYRLRPETTTIQLQSWPGQTALTINQQQKSPTESTTLIVGEQYMLEAPEAIVYNGKVGTFKNWVVTGSWEAVTIAGGTQTIADRQYMLVAGGPPSTYIAFYEYTKVAEFIFLPNVGH